MSGESILIIDDSREMVRHLSRELLPAFGFVTLQATNGQDGLELIRRERPSLIMLDLNLPRMTGLDVLQAMVAESIDVPVILMTGYGSEKSAIEAFRLGVKDYLVKPFTVEEVLSTVDRVLMESRVQHDKERLIRQLQRSESDMRRQLGEQNLLMRLAKKLLALGEEEQIVSHALMAARDVTGSEHAFVCLRPRPPSLALRAYGCVNGEKVPFDLDTLPAHELIFRVLEEGQVVRESTFAGRGMEIVPGYFARGTLMVPLRLDGTVTGVLGVTNSSGPQAFGDREEGMLRTLAEFVALAVHNVRRHDQQQMSAADVFQSPALMALSHDLRAPLNSIVGFATTLQANAGLDEQQQLFTRYIIDAAERLTRLVNSLLDLARLDAGLTEPQELCDLRTVVDSALSDLRGKALAKRVSLEVTNTAQLALVWGNYDRLVQAVTNLVDNALKYSPEGADIRIALCQDDGHVWVEIADKGPGIAAQDLPYIFDQFYRVARNHDKQGTGLGLTLVRSIAEAHGGVVTVESQPTVGSTFTLKLPVAQYVDPHD